MARLTLSDGIRTKDIGCIIFAFGKILRDRLATIGGMTESEVKDVGERQREIEEAITKVVFDGPNKIEVEKVDTAEADIELINKQEKSTVIRFHYDAKLGNTNLVNIVVPEIKGPLVDIETQNFKHAFQEQLRNLLPPDELPDQNPERDEADQHKFDLDYYACEALGSIVILSCGS